ncbi:MAG: hypothetical protein IT184_11455 [Acidobacteria bacterium]|nr:hypothetical protein [Acidobacteriota bacterium]
MTRVDGTSARQLDLIDDRGTPLVPRQRGVRPARMRLVPRDIYAELERRRRRAQRAARHLVDRDDER